MIAQARLLSRCDRLLVLADQALRTLAGTTEGTGRASPASSVPEWAEEPVQLSDAQRRHVAGLMRINHSGEIMAQALYCGQMSTLELDAPLYGHLQQAASEEADHLHWCAERITALGSSTSRLNLVWYVGAFTLGAVAGSMGERYSLGFIAEVEGLVTQHLAGHLEQLPTGDWQTRKVLAQMQEDENQHRKQALQHGGVPLPMWAHSGMHVASKIMTSLAYKI